MAALLLNTNAGVPKRLMRAREPMQLKNDGFHKKSAMQDKLLPILAGVMLAFSPLLPQAAQAAEIPRLS